VPVEQVLGGVHSSDIMLPTIWSPRLMVPCNVLRRWRLPSRATFLLACGLPTM
jgi:hypothetical protein